MQPSVWSIMLPAFVECLVLVGIHSYLGLHVVKRKVIFVDLALAQVAALGATVGFLFGMAPTSRAAFLFSVAFTLVGAAVFALTRLRNDRVPQEAVIGLVYALAAAVSILVVDKSPHGAEHIKDLLTGTILWVRWSEILEAAVAYSVIGAFHFVLRRRFIRISEDPEGAFRAGMWVRLWDFLFYLSFGIVITFSVRTAGVLLVFVFLVAPAISAVLISGRWRTQLFIGWGMGTVVTALALYLSYVLDLPSGPAVVAFYGLVLLVTALVVYVVRAKARRPAALRVALGSAATLLGLAAMWGLGSALGSSALARDEAPEPPAPAASSLSSADPAAQAPSARAGSALVEPGGPEGDDPEQRMARLEQRIGDRVPGWRNELVGAVLDPDLPLLFKERALGLLRKQAGEDFGFELSADDNAGAAERMRAWARQQEGQDEGRGVPSPASSPR